MKKCDAPPAPIETTALELPDWSGLRDSSKLVRPEVAFALSEEYAARFKKAAGNRRSRRREKCLVEFVL